MLGKFSPVFHMNFVVISFLPWTWYQSRPTDCLSYHQIIDNEDSFTIFQLLVADTVQSSLDVFLMPEHLLRDKFFFCNYCSSLQLTIIKHVFSRVEQSL